VQTSKEGTPAFFPPLLLSSLLTSPSPSLPLLFTLFPSFPLRSRLPYCGYIRESQEAKRVNLAPPTCPGGSLPPNCRLFGEFQAKNLAFSSNYLQELFRKSNIKLGPGTFMPDCRRSGIRIPWWKRNFFVYIYRYYLINAMLLDDAPSDSVNSVL